MTQTQMIAAIVALLLAVGGAAVWYAQQYPRVIVGTGRVEVRSERAGGRTLTLETRDVQIRATKFQEVKLPGGSWIACNGDCARAAREAGDGFWDKHQRDHR